MGTRYALIQYFDDVIGWYVYGSRRAAKRAVEYGEIRPGQVLTGASFTGEILTHRQMVRRGLLPR